MKKRSREMNPKKQTLITKLSQNSAPSLIKHLASCNATVRHHSLRLLLSNLSTSEVSDFDIRKLWKGLFYCLWHCDKAPAQSDLINRLTDLIMIQPNPTLLRLSSLPPNQTDLVSINRGFAVRYFEGFLVTMRREWSGIDHLRLDKFYLCIRRFVKAVFCLMRRWRWDFGLLGEFVDVLENNGFFAEDGLLGNGVCYHVVGVFIDELKGCFVPVNKEVVDLVFRPFFRVMEKSLDRVMIAKVRGLVFEELLRIGRELLDMKVNGGSEEDSYDDVAFGLIAVKMGFAGRFYEIGSLEECVQGNRKVVLKLHEEFLKLEKRFESSGIEIEIPDVVPEIEEGDDEEVPELIPIETTEKNGEDSIFDANGEAEEGEDMLDAIEDLRKHKKARKELDGGIKKPKIKKKKEKKNQALDENYSVPECAPVTNNLVEASSTQESKNSVKKRKKKEKKNVAVEGVDSDLSEASLTALVDEILVDKSSSSCEQESNGNVLNESVIANLQKQFENVAAELGSDDENDDDFSLSDAFRSIGEKQTIKRKKNKKRAKSCGPQNLDNEGDDGVNGFKSVDGAKKVRFSMKNNLVWKPHSPLPPQSLRIPPSVTPRGSALKKGVLPGPIREIPPAKKKLKKKKKAKKMLMKNVPWR